MKHGRQCASGAGLLFSRRLWPHLSWRFLQNEVHHQHHHHILSRVAAVSSRFLRFLFSFINNITSLIQTVQAYQLLLRDLFSFANIAFSTAVLQRRAYSQGRHWIMHWSQSSNVFLEYVTDMYSNILRWGLVYLIDFPRYFSSYLKTLQWNNTTFLTQIYRFLYSLTYFLIISRGLFVIRIIFIFFFRSNYNF